MHVYTHVFFLLIFIFTCIGFAVSGFWYDADDMGIVLLQEDGELNTFIVYICFFLLLIIHGDINTIIIKYMIKKRH